MSRPVEKFAKATANQRSELVQIWKHHRLHSVRQRAQGILLSHRQYSASEIGSILGVQAATVRRWIDRFNEGGCDSLEDEERPGGDRSLTEDEEVILRELIETFPTQPRRVLSELKQQTGKVISRSTLRRYCHRFGLKWKRYRRSLWQCRKRTRLSSGSTRHCQAHRSTGYRGCVL